MGKITRGFQEHYLFRRLVLAIELALLFWITDLTVTYVMYATDKGESGAGIAAVAAVLQAPFIALLGYSFKRYSGDRCHASSHAPR
jgi:hypothetical protein